MSLGATLTFKIQVSLRRARDDGPVYKKQDGGRFANNVTVKLNVNTSYSIFITTRPARAVRLLQIKADKLDLDRHKPQRNDDNCFVYHADWSTTGFDVSKSSSREFLPIVVELEDGAHVECQLQVKLYPEMEVSHSRWGQEFHMLDLDCTCQSGQSVVIAQREQYI